MKVKCLLLSTLFIGGMLASCSDNDEAVKKGGEETTDEEASISVKLVGSNSGNRAASASTEEENAIKSFAVYVFNSGDVLEENLVVNPVPDATGLVQTITGLTTGTKKVVVFANLDTYPTVTNASTTYSTFATDIDLDQQNDDIATNGFVMGAMEPVTLVKGVNKLPVPVERAVAKIVIGNISIAKEAGYKDPFAITNVHIMKALPSATLAPATVTGKKGTNLNEEFYGGLADPAYDSKEQKAYLTDALAVADGGSNNASGVVFYVFPNKILDDATLITFQGTYGSNTVYFPFRINELTTQGGNGEFIKRNTVHTINVIFKNPGTGKDNPETPLDPADLEITVSAAPWALTLTHNLEW